MNNPIIKKNCPHCKKEYITTQYMIDNEQEYIYCPHCLKLLDNVYLLKEDYKKDNICCIDNEYKKINTTIQSINIGKMPICKACYTDLIRD